MAAKSMNVSESVFIKRASRIRSSLALDCRFKMLFFRKRLNNRHSTMSRIGFVTSFQQS